DQNNPFPDESLFCPFRPIFRAGRIDGFRRSNRSRWICRLTGQRENRGQYYKAGGKHSADHLSTSHSLPPQVMYILFDHASMLLPTPTVQDCSHDKLIPSTTRRLISGTRRQPPLSR